MGVLLIRNCEIKSIAPYGAFVEIAPGREVHVILWRYDFMFILAQALFPLILFFFSSYDRNVAYFIMLT